MSTRKRFAAILSLIAAAFWQLPAHGLPKAAENEDALVVIVPDVSKPKPVTTPAKKEVTKKKAAPTPTKKPHKPANTKAKPKNRPKP